MPRRARKKPVKRRIRLDTDARRAQLIELGTVAFAEQPYDVVSITDLAASLGMSRGLLYHYFPTKREFYIASMKVIAAQLVSQMTIELAPGLTPIERARASIDAYMDHIHAHSPGYLALMRSGVGRDPEVVAVVDGVRARLIEQIAGELGVRTPPPLLRVALRGWLAFVEAAVLEWLTGAPIERTALRNVFIDTMVATLKGAIAHGGVPRS